MLSKLQIREQFGKRNNWKGLGVLTRDLTFLGLAFWVAFHWGHYWWISILLIWFIGMLQFAMGESLLHEASHGNLFKEKLLNSIVGNLIAYSIFTTLKEWQTEHQIHHGYLLSEQDHLTQDYIDYQLYKGFHPSIIWMIRPIAGIIGIKWAISELQGIFKHKEVFTFYSLLIFFCWWNNNLFFFFFYWTIPLVWAYASFLYWSEITDHYLAKTKTRTNTSFFWNFMFHNGGYHWVHHEYPYIPWYLLKKATYELQPKDRPMDQTTGWWGMYFLMLQNYHNNKRH